MRYPNNKLDGGLYLSGPLNLMPSGTLRRAKGVHPLSVNSVKSRDGSVLLATVSGIISLTYFNDQWFSVVTNDLYMDATIIGTDMFDSTSRATFLPMPPTAGLKDWLFVAGDGNVFKVDTFDTSIVNSDYEWADGGGDNWYLTTAAGGDPKLNPPYFVMENNASGTGTVMAEGVGTANGLTAGQWDWGDFDTLGYNTVYVHLTVATHDPSTLADDYVTVGYLYEWGIKDIPDRLPTIGTATGDLTGTFQYRFTYRNSRTGTRSNAGTGGAGSDKTLVMLMHMDGTNDAQSFVDNSYWGLGTITDTTAVNVGIVIGDVNTTTDDFKFATTAAEMGGTNDALCWYKTNANSPRWSPLRTPFTIDWWARLTDIVSADTHTQFTLYGDSNNWFRVHIVTGTADYVEIHYLKNAVYEMAHRITITIPDNTEFHHYALIRGWGGDTNTWAFTLNGTSLSTWTYSGSISVYSDFIIGGFTPSGGPPYTACADCMIGYIDEFRMQLRANWTANFTAPTYAQATDTTGAISAKYVTLTNLPQSADSQVDTLEIWRTTNGGTAFFKLAEVAKGVTSYDDNAADSLLLSEELPTDNLKPYEWFDDAIFHNASCFWLTRTQAGQKGRVYYSPIGRNEAVQGFINVTEDDDPLQKFTIWAGMLIVFSEGGAFQILGTNPYTARRIAGIPGVRSGSQYTVITTPFGVFWEATDGVRVYTGGTQSYLLAYDAIKPIFRGLAVGNLSAFTGVTATFARGEYHIADGTQHIAYHIEDKKWRDCSLATDALHYAEDADILGAAHATILYDFENEGEADDGVTDIAFEIEKSWVPPTHLANEVDLICQRVVVDVNTNEETLSVNLVVDGTATDLGDVSNDGRAQSEFPAGKIGTVFSVRLAGALDTDNQAVEVFDIAFDIYNPREGK